MASLDPNRMKKKKKQQAVAVQGAYMIFPCNFTICDTAKWVLYTKSLIHICNSLQGLRVSRRFEDGKRFLNVRNENAVPVLALGVLELFFESYKITLSD